MQNKMNQENKQKSVKIQITKNDDYKRYESYMYDPQKMKNSNSQGNLEHYLNQDVIEEIPKLEIKFQGINYNITSKKEKLVDVLRPEVNRSNARSMA